MADPNLTIEDFLKSQEPNQGPPQQSPASTPPELSLEEFLKSQPPPQTVPAPPPQQAPQRNSMDEFIGGLSDTANPAKMWQGAKTAFQHPGLTWNTLVEQQKEPFHRAREAWNQGEYGEALNHLGNGLLPLVGPQMETIEDLVRQGNTARAVGQAVGLAAPILLTEGAGLGARALTGATRAGEAVEAALPETASQTAARVVEEGATPENALQKMIKARDLNQLRDVYEKTSPKMKPWITQQMIMQIAKDTAGNPAAFGARMAELGQAVPLDQLTAWDTVGKVARTWQAMKAVPRAVEKAVPPAVIQGLPPAAVVGSTPATLEKIGQNPVIDLRKWGMSEGGAIERIKRNTLSSLYR